MLQLFNIVLLQLLFYLLLYFLLHHFLSLFLHPAKTPCGKCLCLNLIVPCVSSYRWVHFSRAVLFYQPHQQLFTHSSICFSSSPQTDLAVTEGVLIHKTASGKAPPSLTAKYFLIEPFWKTQFLELTCSRVAWYILVVFFWNSCIVPDMSASHLRTLIPTFSLMTEIVQPHGVEVLNTSQ